MKKMNFKATNWLLSTLLCFIVITIKPDQCFGMIPETTDSKQSDCLLVLEQAPVRDFLVDLLSLYWDISGLPKESLPSMFKILSDYRQDPEFAVQLVQNNFPDLTRKDSLFYSNYQRARGSKFKTFSKAILPFVRPGVIADVGGEDTQLVDELLAMNPSIDLAYVTDINMIKKNPKNKKVRFVFQPEADSTPLPKKTVDTIILSTVLHHIDPPVRLKLLIHLTEVLREGGRLIIVEDSFPELLSKDAVETDLDKRFLDFDEREKISILAFLDWWGNRLMKNSREIPLPFSFKSMEKWGDLFSELGLNFVERLYLGIPVIHSHVMAPKAILVFEKPGPAKPKLKLPCEECPVKSIIRDDSNTELAAFVPKSGVNINLSIGGSKIETSLVDSEAKTRFILDEFSWRDALSVEPRTAQFDGAQKREWFLSKIREQLMAAVDLWQEGAGERYPIEGIGISWAGPVKPGGKVIGPNIEGFKFKDLSEDEAASGGIDLAGLVKMQISTLPALQSASVELLNDGDASAIGYFRTAKVNDGIMLIIGTGIGSGMVKDGKVLFSVNEKFERLGEIGHHILFEPDHNRYFYYGTLTRGKILEQMTPYSISERLAGPGLVRRCLARLKRDMSGDSHKIHAYLNSCDESDGIVFSEFELCACDLNVEAGPLLEKKILSFITVKALNGDKFAWDFVAETGFEIGLGVGTLIKEFEHEPFVRQIVLTGGLGKHFGRGLLNSEGEDLFSSQIMKGIRWSLKYHDSALNEPFLKNMDRLLDAGQTAEQGEKPALFNG